MTSKNAGETLTWRPWNRPWGNLLMKSYTFAHIYCMQLPSVVTCDDNMCTEDTKALWVITILRRAVLRKVDRAIRFNWRLFKAVKQKKELQFINADASYGLSQFSGYFRKLSSGYPSGSSVYSLLQRLATVRWLKSDLWWRAWYSRAR